MNMMLNFNRPKKDSLMYGKRVCPKNHTDMQDRVVRRKTGGCWACQCGLPEGKFNFDFGDLPEQVYGYHGKYKTDEEKQQARIDAQMRWNERNYDKFRTYQKKYEGRADIKEKRAIAAAERYQAHKEECIKKRKIYYEENKEYILAQCKARYERKRDEHKRQEAERKESSARNESVATELVSRIFGT
jgi:hypothetical protein